MVLFMVFPTCFQNDSGPGRAQGKELQVVSHGQSSAEQCRGPGNGERTPVPFTSAELTPGAKVL